MYSNYECVQQYSTILKIYIFSLKKKYFIFALSKLSMKYKCIIYYRNRTISPFTFMEYY